TKEFVERFRAAQIARNRRITTWCQDMLERLRKRGGPEQERAFVVHRTMCDVRWFDTSIDPNDRKPGWSYMGDPRTVNVGPVGLARYSTLRSWLSQWSYDLSNAKGPMNARLIRRSPVLQIENNADEAVPATHNPAIAAALATPDKQYLRIPGAAHYALGHLELLKMGVVRVTDSSPRHGLRDGCQDPAARRRPTIREATTPCLPHRSSRVCTTIPFPAVA